jgi:hypothetical protein
LDDVVIFTAMTGKIKCGSIAQPGAAQLVYQIASSTKLRVDVGQLLQSRNWHASLYLKNGSVELDGLTVCSSACRAHEEMLRKRLLEVETHDGNALPSSWITRAIIRFDIGLRFELVFVTFGTLL